MLGLIARWGTTYYSHDGTIDCCNGAFSNSLIVRTSRSHSRECVGIAEAQLMRRYSRGRPSKNALYAPRISS